MKFSGQRTEVRDSSGRGGLLVGIVDGVGRPRQSPELHRGSKHPILVSRKLGSRLPGFQHPQHLGINGHRLLGIGGSYVADPLADDAPLDRELTFQPSDIAPSRRETLANAETEADAYAGYRAERLVQVPDEGLKRRLVQLDEQFHLAAKLLTRCVLTERSEFERNAT